MTDHMQVPDRARGQMEDAAFWLLDDGVRTPIDRRAVYGYPLLGDRAAEDIEAPVRAAPRDLRTAIRVLGSRQNLNLHHPDMVRVNDGSWMDVVQPSRGKYGLTADEGFICRPVNGEKLRVVEPTNGVDRPAGTSELPWMRRVDGWVSEGEVGCMEVAWADERREP